jgi:FAD/FMN-containing dehydrogenase
MTSDTDTYRSWGGLRAGTGPVLRPLQRSAIALPNGPWLGFGNGRSYGDSCFPAVGTLIDMRGLNGLISFNPASGVIRAEAGLLLSDLLPHVIPHGWFPAVVPGTRFVTLGGAVANDIHGKNHHEMGTFGEHVLSLELLRSDGSHLVCSSEQNTALFRATIGGMGLTGLILSVELQLMRIGSPNVEQETLALDSLADFFRLAPLSDASHAYSVAWIDSLATGSRLGRGVLLRANHLDSSLLPAHRGRPLLSIPFTPPFSMINRWSLAAFNRLYRRRALSRGTSAPVDFTSFFFPLDAVGHWNRLYGPGGLRQHQSVVPLAVAEHTFAAMLEETQRARHGSFLTVLKLFSERPAAGLMSFPRAGATLTLDFPYRGDRTDALLDRLDALTIAAGGRVNPYKDAHMTAETFASSFPNIQTFRQHMDPMARSAFAHRVGLVSAPHGATFQPLRKSAA